MAEDPDKFLYKAFNQEVEDVDTVLRRIDKRHHVNEEKNIKLTAFLLRKNLFDTGKPENQISVVIEKVGVPDLQNKNWLYCRLQTKQIRKINVGVWHSPNDHPKYKSPHGSLCGKFDEQKALDLSRIAKVV